MTAEFKNGAFEPGVYVKGQVARRVETPSEAAKYVWDGYVRQADEAPAKSEESPSESEGGEKASEPGDPGPTTLDLAESADKVVGESAPEPKRGPGRPRKPAGGDQ